ncbi:MAG: DUF262 domain-containing protein [Candidatus Woesearchaeota archaeon]
MRYECKTIKEIVESINTKCFLPHIQRELVWKPPQIIKLFDSLMRKYPIGTFLFWKIAKRKKEIMKLEFIKNYKSESKNEINRDTNREEYWLVLDGQQRLQSFFIALNGSYHGKELFFNALSNKAIEGNDDESEVIYETRFFKSDMGNFMRDEVERKTKNQVKKLWIKVKDFSLLDEDKIYDFITQQKENYGEGISYGEAKLLEKNLKAMNALITSTESVFYYLEPEEDYDKVLDIFVRTNSGGTKLSKSDLLFSIIKLKWKKLDAYNEFNALLREINDRGDFDFDTDFILKTSLVLINKDVKYRVENFNPGNVKEIENKWSYIKDSIKATIDLIVNDFRISSKKQLTSRNSIIPIIEYTYVNGIKTYQSDKKGMFKTKEIIRKWLFSVLLTNLFSGQTDELLRRFREVIKNNKGLFPIEKMNNALPPGKNLEIGKEDFGGISYGDGSAFLVLGLLYPQLDTNPASEKNKPQIDHIFPVSLLKKKYPLAQINSIGNLQFLTATENRSKNKLPFKEWMRGLNSQFMEKSFIPQNKRLWALDDYAKFVEKRIGIMFRRVKEILTH